VRSLPFQEFSPEQAALLPVPVREVRSEKHLVFLISALVEKQDRSEWESAYSEQGQRPSSSAANGFGLQLDPTAGNAATLSNKSGATQQRRTSQCAEGPISSGAGRVATQTL
jgi:hypothetical protein